MKRELDKASYRAVAATFLLLAQLALGLSIHRHSTVLETIDLDESGPPRAVHEISCSEPTASHWHRDRIVELEPCLACLRQHLAGIRVDPPTLVPLRVVRCAARPVIPEGLTGFAVEPASRGPPSSI